MAGGGTFRLIDSYYTRPAAGPSFTPGQICDAITFHLPPALRFLRLDYEAANRGERVTYDVVAQDAQTFDHTPVTRPERLEQHEAFVVSTAKKRPGVILSTPIMSPADAGALRKDFPEAFLIAPLFSFKDTHPQEFRRRLAAFEYNMLFYLPSDGESEIEEGFLRLDRCQVVPKGQLRLRRFGLTNDALTVLSDVFHWFVTGTLDPDIAESRRIQLEAIGRTV